jgi:hypothetical protein
MSPTPEQVADRLEALADTASHEAYNASAWEPSKDELEDANTLRAAAALIRAQAERVRVLESALAEIAKQVPAKDMDEDYYEAADFEDGYDRCVFAARAALAGAR